MIMRLLKGTFTSKLFSLGLSPINNVISALFFSLPSNHNIFLEKGIPQFTVFNKLAHVDIKDVAL